MTKQEFRQRDSEFRSAATDEREAYKGWTRSPASFAARAALADWRRAWGKVDEAALAWMMRRAASVRWGTACAWMAELDRV